MEGDVITLQDIFIASLVDDGEGDQISTHDAYTGIRPDLHREARAARRVAAKGFFNDERRQGGRAATRAAQERVMRLRAQPGAGAGGGGHARPGRMAAGGAPTRPRWPAVEKIGSHSVRVTVKAPGDLGPGDVQAQLGGRLADDPGRCTGSARAGRCTWCSRSTPPPA